MVICRKKMLCDRSVASGVWKHTKHLDNDLPKQLFSQNAFIQDLIPVSIYGRNVKVRDSPA